MGAAVDMDSRKGAVGKSDTLCIASTPFQLFSLLSIIQEDLSTCGDSWDLIIYDQFPNAGLYAERIMKEGVFRKVYIGNPGYPNYRHVGLCHLASLVVSPVKKDKRFENTFPDLVKNKYRRLYCAFPEKIALEAKRICVPNGATVFYDDGTASRNDTVFKTFSCFDEKALSVNSDKVALEKIKYHAKRLLIKAIPKNARLNIEELRIFSPVKTDHIQKAGIKVNPIRIPMGFELHEKVMLLKHDKCTTLRKDDFIYLTLPAGLKGSTLANEQRILRVMDKALGDRLKIRVHPRRLKSDFDEFGTAIIGDEFWELLIAKGEITEESTLIAVASTAQMTPKMIFGVEPRLILLHELFPVFEGTFTGCSQIERDIKAMYSKPEKVMVPKEITDIETLISGELHSESFR